MANGVNSQRPLSPHLQVWRFTVTMAASITHRGTGAALYSGSVLLALWLITASLGEEQFALVGNILASPIGLIVLTGYCWAICFHMLNGIRHLYWDTGRGLAKETATKTAWAIYIGATVLTIIIVTVGLSARGGA